MRNEKKHRRNQKNIALKKVKQYEKYNIHTLDGHSRNQRVDENKDTEEKIAHIYKLFYAELMKLFVVEVELKDSNLTETELDQNIFLSAEEYYKINNDIYQVY